MINEVRNAVLSVLNKNNYGYISPSDFNLYAANAQMELYEEYYSNYNKTINAENLRTSGTDYADIESPLAETLETFLVTNYLEYLDSNRYFIPSLITTGDTSYYILNILCYPILLATGDVTANFTNRLIDSSALFLSDGISEGDIVANISKGQLSTVLQVFSNTTIILTDNIFTTLGDDYKIFSSKVKEADKVSVGKITMLNSSILTQPSDLFPSYTLEGEIIKVYPTTIKSKGQVKAVYFRHPKAPKWTYVQLNNGEPSFDQSQPDYQDFELPKEDGYKLVTKILEYCGISIRETEVTQFGMAQQQHEQPTFSMQQ
jgi:hypothetical protein